MQAGRQAGASLSPASPNPAHSLRPWASDIKKVNANQQQERYRVTLSDGQWTTLAVLSNQLSEVARNNVLKTNSVVRLNDFLVNNVSNNANGQRRCAGWALRPACPQPTPLFSRRQPD